MELVECDHPERANKKIFFHLLSNFLNGILKDFSSYYLIKCYDLTLNALSILLYPYIPCYFCHAISLSIHTQEHNHTSLFLSYL